MSDLWVQTAMSFSAGALAVISPCTLPILPGVVGALSQGPGGRRGWNRVALVGLFAAGAAIALVGSVCIVIALGIGIDLASPPYSVLLGALFILLAMTTTGIITVPARIQNTTAFRRVMHLNGWGRAPLMGMALALAWMPCIGPSLGMILALSSQLQTAGQGLFLSIVYFLGLAMPIFLFGLLAQRFANGKKWASRAGRIINYVLAGAMFLIGVLLLLGRWDDVSAWIVSVSPQLAYVL